MSSRIQGKLKLAFTWSLISLARLLVIGPIIVGDLSMVVVSSSAGICLSTGLASHKPAFLLGLYRL